MLDLVQDLHDTRGTTVVMVLHDLNLAARYSDRLVAMRAWGVQLSAGQRQLIAFARALIADPRILILDEATANIDTLTEKLLGEILRELPPSTTKVVIAHRLNTIENADEILFVNDGEITRAGSMQDALDLLLHHKRAS